MSKRKKKGGKNHKANIQLDTLVAIVNLTAAIVNLVTALILFRIAFSG